MVRPGRRAPHGARSAVRSEGDRRHAIVAKRSMGLAHLEARTRWKAVGGCRWLCGRLWVARALGDEDAVGAQEAAVWRDDAGVGAAQALVQLHHAHCDKRGWPQRAGEGGWTAVEGCGRLWKAVDGCGRLWTAVDRCGRLWKAVDGCGRLWTAVEGELWSVSRGRLPRFSASATIAFTSMAIFCTASAVAESCWYDALALLMLASAAAAAPAAPASAASASASAFSISLSSAHSSSG